MTAKTMLSVSALLLLSAACGRPARAEVIHVPADYPTIQQAINEAAEAGDEIIVAEGEYNEAINFLGKAIWLHSADGPEVTIIDGEGLDTSVVTCASGEGPGTTLEGFTITNGVGTLVEDDRYGGGMYNVDSSPTVSNCIFATNDVDPSAHWGYGGGMYNDSGDPTVIGCTFIANTAPTSGGGMYNRHSDATVTGCTFAGNIAESGGGMYNYSADPTVTSCTFDGNTAVYSGGAMDNCVSQPTLKNCTFVRNWAFDAGGIYNECLCDLTAVNCTFTDNSAQRLGGGFYNYYSTPTVRDCTFEGNTAERGGGMCIRYSGPHITGCSFIGNSAQDYGGGMYNETGDFALPPGMLVDGRRSRVINATVTNCTFEGNTAPYGGGMCNYECYGDGPTVVNCLFKGNFGLGALCDYYCWDAPPIINCTFTGNKTWAIANIDGSSPIVTNCILWSDGSGEILNDPGNPIVTYCDVQGGYAGEGNIDADPLFVDPDNHNFRIGPGSPCIDAGDNTAVPPDTFDLDEDGDIEEPIPFDFDGNPRFVDDPYTQDTGVGYPCVDMGAYEYQGPGCPADFDGDGDVDTADLLYLLGAWGTPAGDVDGDGNTDTADLLALLAAWGECP